MANKMKKAEILGLIAEIGVALRVIQDLDDYEDTLESSLRNEKYLSMQQAKTMCAGYATFLKNIEAEDPIPLLNADDFGPRSTRKGIATVIALESVRHKKKTIWDAVFKAIEVGLRAK